MPPVSIRVNVSVKIWGGGGKSRPGSNGPVLKSGEKKAALKVHLPT